jgi:hypothetical protein
MTRNVKPMDFAGLLHVCRNLRPCNQGELYPTRAHNDPEELALELFAAVRAYGFGVIVWHKAPTGIRPAIAIGLFERWPGVWGLMMIGTDDFKAAAIDALRWLRGAVADLRDKQGMHRLHSETRADDPEAARFFLGLGAIPEGPPMERYGKGGEAFQRYCWLAGINDQFAKAAA